MTSHPSELAEARRLRADADLEDARAELNRVWATELHGKGRHDFGFAIERRAERQELSASRMREDAREIEDNLKARARLFEVAGEITGAVNV